MAFDDHDNNDGAVMMGVPGNTENRWPGKVVLGDTYLYVLENVATKG